MLTEPDDSETLIPYDFEMNGSRIILRPPRVDDEAAWIAVRSKNKEMLVPYEPGWSRDALTPQFYQRRMVRVRRAWGNDLAYSFLILHKETEEIIGGINLNNVCRGAAQYASIGYWLDKDCWRGGYMRAALRMITYFSHERLKLNRLNASVLPTNERSINLLKRIGFEEEGFARKYIEINEVWEDHVLYGLVLKDFMAREDRRKERRA